MRLGSNVFKNLAKFKYLGKAITNLSDIYNEIKCGLNSGNTCYHSVFKLLPSHLLSKCAKIKTHKNIVSPIVLNGFESWSRTLREKNILMMIKNKILKMLFDPRGDELQKD
jgi:hypothetical protein